MAKVINFTWSLGSENLPILVLGIGAFIASYMLVWGDAILAAN